MKRKNSIKIMAMYLPQYHEIPENSYFWGKGFTDWVSVRSAKPLYEGHNQPNVPIDSEYYDLSQKEAIVKQAELAKKYGVYGFGLYHYWFSDEKNLLTAPSEIILGNKDIDIPFFFAWDNSSWKRTWSRIKGGNDWAPKVDQTVKNEIKEEDGYLVKYVLGREPQWENHYNYLSRFFHDERYVKIDNKPLFFIYNYSKEISEMEAYFDVLAKKDGFDGINIVYRKCKVHAVPNDKNIFNYEPSYSGWEGYLTSIKNKLLKKKKKRKLRKYDYDVIWRKILKVTKKRAASNFYHGAFVSYDDTPRRGERGSVVVGNSPTKFQKYLSELIRICDKQDKEYVFLTAWNEWGEGAYLEPDVKNGYAYLEAVKKALSETENGKN